MENINDVVVALKSSMESLVKQMDKLADLPMMVMRMSEKQANTDREIAQLTSSVNELKNRPAKKWDKVIDGVIGALVVAFIGFLFLKASGKIM